MKEPIKKKVFLTEQQKQEKKQKERIERQNEILKNRSEGLQQWSKDHASAKLIFECVMNALDYVPKEHKKTIVNFLKMPLIEFNYNHTDYLQYEDDIDDMDAVFEMLREIHDISAEEVGLESYQEYCDRLCKEDKKHRVKRRRKVKQEEAEAIDLYDSSEIPDLPF